MAQGRFILNASKLYASDFGLDHHCRGLQTVYMYLYEQKQF